VEPLDPNAIRCDMEECWWSMRLSDPLPANTAIWLRKLAGPPEPGFYRYSGSAPKAWQPIFGTAGTTNALYWNTDMFQ
jgi:hypothetical protein